MDRPRILETVCHSDRDGSNGRSDEWSIRRAWEIISGMIYRCRSVILHEAQSGAYEKGSKGVVNRWYGSMVELRLRTRRD